MLVIDMYILFVEHAHGGHEGDTGLKTPQHTAHKDKGKRSNGPRPLLAAASLPAATKPNINTASAATRSTSTHEGHRTFIGLPFHLLCLLICARVASGQPPGSRGLAATRSL